MKRSALLATGILFVLLAALQVPAQAQMGGWLQPAMVSDPQKTPSSWFPDLAIGPDSSVHIIWSSGLRGEAKGDHGEDLLMYRYLRDGQWSSINDIMNPGSGGYTVRNSIIMGHDGELHALYRQGLVTVYTSAPWDSAWSALSWSTPRAINGSGSYFNALATDSSGTLHAVWSEAIPDDTSQETAACSFCSDLFYRSSNNDGLSWSIPINLSQSVQGSVKPQIKVDASGVLHVVWEEGFDWYASHGEPISGMYRRSRDGGATWDEPVRFTLPSLLVQPDESAATPASAQPTQPALPTRLANVPQQITLGLYQNREPLVVYRDTATDTIYYQVSSNGGAVWGNPQTIPGIRARNAKDTYHDAYTMATDGSGNVHLICTGFLTGDTEDYNPLKLLHLVWDGRRWSAPEVITTDSTYPQAEGVTSQRGLRLHIYPEWPRALISGNRMYLTWFTRNQNDLFASDVASYQVWFTSKQLAGTALAPVVQFTPLPATPVQTFAPTAIPTAVPTLPPEAMSAPLVDRSLAWEAPGLVIVGIALLPTLGIVGLVLGVRFMRRRYQRP